ncbi:biotin--[acetyl-CoA-carboxylase] ligase [Erythrobacteraceae bacterium CFH 75059]|uniref:biotin--[acetyl-CoA-carboxylase] ligase n=1 Tax=Qipengyuania thermophila TaxID=2509361 RepID=UPI0010211D24|nr:biotin--[acetyl-CoA-carboxylase] ligase [Qipengyuania thermophila]TCD05289.1 biotin--[acetyl-CoA-carboxylase] ligase [Erythrobacteraceae bacterium CFH 75059]
MSGRVGPSISLRTVRETGSTNSDLLARIAAGDPPAEGEWLIADRQSDGRGRLGRHWHDGSGNFMGSTAVRVTATDPAPASLSLAAGLALFEAVRPCLAPELPLMLKWPNDLLIGKAKAAGILLERQQQWVVVGIGVNLASAPALPDRPTVALAQFGPSPDRDTFAAALAEHMAECVARWRSHGLGPIIRDWLDRAHPAGTPLSFRAGASEETGRFQSLTADGALLVRTADGTVRQITAGDVSLVTEV